MIVVDRFWKKIVLDDPDACWEWCGARDEDGYGRFRVGGRSKNGGTVLKAHRFAYEIRQGPVPTGLELDHLCRNPSCVNPAHLEPVTRRENQLRGYGAAGRNARKTHCPRGHEFTAENTYVSAGPHGKKRTCRACKLVSQRQRRERGQK